MPRDPGANRPRDSAQFRSIYAQLALLGAAGVHPALAARRNR